MKNRDRVIRFLTEGLHCIETPCRSGKYRQFNKGDRHYFAGKAGAVRAGNSASNSVSITTGVWNNMKLWEKKKGL